jgi:hypothetical protein
MSELVEHLAELTGSRDRDVLDVTLAGAFRDLLRPRSVAIYRTVGDGANQRWITRARLAEGDAVPTADPAWVDLETLPMLARHPARCAALIGQTILTREGDADLAVFPLSTDREVVGVLEMVTHGTTGRRAAAPGVQHPAHLPQLPGPAGLQRTRHAHRAAQSQDLRRELPEDLVVGASADTASDTRRAAGPGSRLVAGHDRHDHFRRSTHIAT